MDKIRCFFIKKTDKYREYLKRFAFNDKKCKNHNTQVQINEFISKKEMVTRDHYFHTDSRWPKKCENCGYKFKKDDYWRRVFEKVYECPATEKEMILKDAPVGAMFYDMWYSRVIDRNGPDGRTLYVKTPGGIWNIDGRASNCDLKTDDIHYCWVRKGIPPDITVTKGEVGESCNAGSGSIRIGGYHGHLTDGCLIKC